MMNELITSLIIISISISHCDDKLNAINEDLTVGKSGGNDFERAFPEKPIQLVRPDLEHKRLVIVEENVKLLYRILGPVATVAVVGKFHSGKSFLMNQLMGKNNGFGVGPDVRPKTMGIWMWGKPTQYTLKSGLKVSVIFMDTEGFASNNVSEDYDAKIFAVSTLLSSQLLYNSVKIIDQSDIDYLELLARRTQLFALRSQMSRQKWTNLFDKELLSFPPLIWVVQDFVQSYSDGEESPTQWLHRLMTSHIRENEKYEISLKDIFKSVDCHTLFLPAVKKHLLNDLSLAHESELTEEYKFEREELIEKLKKQIVPKEKNGEPITGLELAALLEVLVNAANDGSLTSVPNRWDSFVNKLQQTALHDCLKFYEADMNVLIIDDNNNSAINMKKFDEWHNQSFDRTKELLTHLLHGLDDLLKEAIRDLGHRIMIIYENSRDTNEKRIKLKCSDSQAHLLIKSQQLIRSIELPIVTSKLLVQAKDILKTIKSEYIKEISDLVDHSTMEQYLDALDRSIRNQIAAHQLKNNQAIEAFFDKHIDNALRKFTVAAQSDYSRIKPRKPTILERIIEDSNRQALDTFNNQCHEFTVENAYESKLAVLTVRINAKITELKAENEKIAEAFIVKESVRLLDEFEDRTSITFIPLPINSTDLEARLKLEIGKSLRDFTDMLSDFQIYQSYQQLWEKFRERLGLICEKRRNENIKAFTKEVREPLRTAKDTILVSQDKYSTVFSFKLFIHHLCLIQLNRGKPKWWSSKLKSDIIDEFIADDEDLQKLIKQKTGLWSKIFGFYEWILWILGLKVF